jgi:glycosyltransferase involved in cell wall biosynthesis
MKRQRILFLTQLLPYPLNSGGKITIFKTLEFLAGDHDLDLVCHAWSRQDYAHQAVFRRMVREFVMLDLRRRRPIPHFILQNLRGRPYFVFRDVSRAMEEAVRKQLEKNRYDLIYTDIFMIPHIPAGYSGRTVLEKLNFEAELVSRYRTLHRNPAARILLSLEARNLLRFELESSASVEKTVTLTEKDRQSLVEHGAEAANIIVIPPGTQVGDVQPVELDSGSKEIVHVGTAHWPPNVDGLIWFAGEVFPKVVRAVPEARLRIVGKEPPRRIRKLHNGTDIHVQGYVEDLGEIDRRTGVFIAPLRMGGGIRIKILEALAKALPVVTTSVGCEGIGVEPGRHLLVGDTAGDFAGAVIRLLLDPSLRKRMGEEGRGYVLSHFGKEKRNRRLADLISAGDG